MGNYFTARTGIQAALMTAHGFESLPNEIDEKGEEYDLDALANPKDRFHHTATNLFLKPWPTSHGCHMVVQSIQELVEEKRCPM